MPAQQRAWGAENPSGAHFLRDRPAADLVRLADVGPDDLVFDLGAGLGALTAPLAATGARVVAVERHEGYARRLRHRFAGEPNVNVVTGDLLSVPLPGRDFGVVANIPFATTAALLRRLLDPPKPRLAAAYLVVEWGAATRLAARSRTTAGAWWGARFDIRRVRRMPRDAFRPPPTVDGAVLAITRADLSPAAESVLRALLRQAERYPYRPLRALLAGRLGPDQLRTLGLDPRLPAASVPGSGWRAVASAAVASAAVASATVASAALAGVVPGGSGYRARGGKARGG